MSDRLKFLLSSVKKELQTSKDAESRAIGIISEIEKDMKSKDDEDISAKIAAMSADDIDKIIDETTSQDNDEKKADKKSSNENESNKRSKLRVCVCGGGHGGHAFVATIAGKLKPTFECNWFSMRGGDELGENIKKNGGYIDAKYSQEKVVIRGTPNVVSSDACKVIPGCDIIILCMPAYSHSKYLKEINKHHESCNDPKSNKKLIIASFPCSAGLEFEASNLNNYGKGNIILASCLILPWACRYEKYGTLVEILGVKTEIEVTVCNDDDKKHGALGKLQSLFIDNVPRLIDDSSNHIVSTSIAYPQPIAHTCILYGQWKDWDGSELAEKPLFYHGITKETANYMIKMGDEYMEICERMNQVATKLGCKRVQMYHIRDCFYKYYADVCPRTDTMWDVIVTNPGYNGLVHPMIPGKKDAKKWLPNWDYRYLTEDVPFGLLVAKSFAEMCDGLKTPIIDNTLEWVQKVMKRKYVNVKKDDKTGEKIATIDFQSQDVKKSRVPQIFGLKTLEDVLSIQR